MVSALFGCLPFPLANLGIASQGSFFLGWQVPLASKVVSTPSSGTSCSGWVHSVTCSVDSQSGPCSIGAPRSSILSLSLHPSTVTASHSSASSTCLPSVGLLRGTMSSAPHVPHVVPLSSTVSHSCLALPPAQGSNASGFAVAAPSAMLAGLTLAVSSVGAGAVFMTRDTPPGLHIPMAAWTSPRCSKPLGSPGAQWLGIIMGQVNPHGYRYG